MTIITKNAIFTTTNAEGTIVANMGDDNYITFRTVAGSNSPGVIATIEFNFIELLETNSYKLKFYP